MKTPNKISSITALHNLFNLQKPLHPLISVFDITDIAMIPDALRNAIYTDFYVIALKRDCGGKCRYGQQFYDFEEGIMFFIAPNQVFQLEDVVLSQVKGSVLIVHPDFLQGYQLAAMVKNYGYFSYSINEALHLSEQEEKMIKEIMDNIKHETEMNIDAFTQDLLVSNIDLLLKYCDRFYNRQFLTRKKVNNDLLGILEVLLDD